MEIGDEAGEEFEDSVSDLETLIEKFLIDEFLDGKPILPLIKRRRLELRRSVSRLKLLQLKMILDKINDNRRRIAAIFQQIDNAEDIVNWKTLAREGLISEEQFKELKNLENTDIEEIASILKGGK